MSTAVPYPVLDSVHNLRIGVRLERLVAASGDLPSFSAFVSDARNIGTEPEEQTEQARSELEEYVFRWQEKVFSAAEFLRYSTEENCTTDLQKQYHRKIAELRELGARPTERLFTYVEGDDYTKNQKYAHLRSVDENQGSNSAETSSRTARRRRIAPQGKIALRNPVTDAPAKKSTSAGQSVHAMYIMVYTGAKDAHEMQDEDVLNEKVICTVKLVNDSQIWIDPDFSMPTQKPYRIEGKIGVFNFKINNESPKAIKEMADMEKQKESQLFAYKTDLLQSKIGGQFDVPETGVLKTLVLVEILRAKGFEYDNLYIEYVVELPKGWYCASNAKRLEGVTPICKTSIIDEVETACFTYPIELDLCYNLNPYDPDPGLLPKWPHILICVMSLDGWSRHRTEGYGFITLPTQPGNYEHTIHTWRPINSREDELRRYFIGGSPELEDISCARLPKGQENGRLSKMGLKTTASGSVEMRFNVIHQCRSFISEERQKQLKYGAVLQKIGATPGMHPGIVSVLEAFQKARHRMLSVRENVFVDTSVLDSETTL